jgi:hypothetical protein
MNLLPIKDQPARWLVRHHSQDCLIHSVGFGLRDGTGIRRNGSDRSDVDCSSLPHIYLCSLELGYRQVIDLVLDERCLHFRPITLRKGVILMQKLVQASGR